MLLYDAIKEVAASVFFIITSVAQVSSLFFPLWKTHFFFLRKFTSATDEDPFAAVATAVNVWCFGITSPRNVSSALEKHSLWRTSLHKIYEEKQENQLIPSFLSERELQQPQAHRASAGRRLMSLTVTSSKERLPPPPAPAAHSADRERWEEIITK